MLPTLSELRPDGAVISAARPANSGANSAARSIPNFSMAVLLDKAERRD